MAQAWHNQGRQPTPTQGVEAWCWRATKYELVDRGGSEVIEAAPDARWERFIPFDLYKPASKARELRAGPHLMYLNLWNIHNEKFHLYNKALELFVNQYGLLGVFEEDYLPRPLLPEGKIFVAPEAIIDTQGRIQRVDPATEGKDLLNDLLKAKGYVSSEEAKSDDSYISDIALPSEMRFIPTNSYEHDLWWHWEEPRQIVPWEKIKEDFGALLILDDKALDRRGVSVLCTREPTSGWPLSLLSGETPVEYMISYDHGSLNTYLKSVSPCVLLGEDGTLERGWLCRSLWQAMQVMLYLDLTGGNTIKECQSRGCQNYFRVGPQSKSIYCSPRCANRASTRKRRGQEP